MKSEMTSTPRPAAYPRLAIGIEHLWALIVLAGVGCFIALVPTPPNDFWWHLKAGEIVATQGIPTTNLFAWTLPADHPYVYATWLGEWLFYALYRVGGLQTIVVARNMLGLLAFTLVALDARRRSGSWRLAALAALLACAMTINNLIIRTQNWSWVPFGLYLLLLGAYAAGQLRPRWLLALPPVMAFWVNAHGAFVLGLALLALYCAGETLRRLLDQPGALPWARLRPLYLAAAGALVATLINPLGPGIFGYVVKLLTDPPSQGLIVEWQPPATRGLTGSIFYASILALIVALSFARRKPSVTDLLLLCAFLWLAWSGQRYVVWFGMLAMPMLALCLAPAPRTGAQRPARGSLINLIPAAILALLLLVVQPPFKAALPLPPSFTDSLADLPEAPASFDAGTPVAAAEYLRTHPLPGRLFNEMGYGSYLDWALYPQAQVFVDPRVELYPFEIWQDYVAISAAREYNALLIDKYNVARVMLDRKAQPQLAAALRADRARWALEYQDRQTEIYRRK